jgi:hypothetical protein
MEINAELERRGWLQEGHPESADRVPAIIHALERARLTPSVRIPTKPCLSKMTVQLTGTLGAGAGFGYHGDNGLHQCHRCGRGEGA